MITTSADVDTSMADLLGRVLRGEEIPITKDGKIVARLVPPAAAPPVAEDDDDDDRPWRGLFVPDAPFPTKPWPPPPDVENMPQRKPDISFGWHRPYDDDDE